MDLSTDPRVVALLRADNDWCELVHRASVGSTQDLALERLRGGAPAGLVVVADAQQAGRGRRGRRWQDAVVGPSGPGSLAITATLAAPSQAAELVPLAAGLAVVGAYRAAGVVAGLKWPNDVLVDGRKAAGILVERHQLGDGRSVLLVGCGLDIDWRGVVRDPALGSSISLAEHLGRAVDRTAVLVDVLRELGAWLQELRRDPAGLVAAYRPLCATVGETVRIQRPGGDAVVGRALGVDDGGRLVVDVGGGRVVVDAGEVVHVRRA